MTEGTGRDKKKKNTGILKINRALFYTLMPVLIFLSRIVYRMRIDRSAIKGMKGPFLVLGNHTCPIDFLFFTGSLYPRKITYVVAANMYYRDVYGWFIRKYNCIPKKQFTADYSCIKSIKRFLDSGISVLLFPEGRVTVDGTTGYVAPAVGKLIKWLKYPVIAGITSGGYVSHPKWGHSRLAKVSLEVKPVLSREEIEKLSAEEITEIVREKLAHNDNEAFVRYGRKITGTRLAEGLETILYKCPKCGAEFRNETKGSLLTCPACGNAVRYGRDGIIRPADGNSRAFGTIDEWMNFQREDLRKQVENPDFILSDRVRYVLNNPKENCFTEMGEGILSVSRDSIEYRDGKNDLSFRTENHRSLAFKMGENLEVADGDDIHRFIFLDGGYSTKYVLAVEALHERYF